MEQDWHCHGYAACIIACMPGSIWKVLTLSKCYPYFSGNLTCMPQFKLRPEGFAVVRKKIITRFIGILLFAMLIVVMVDYQKADGYKPSPYSWLLTFLFTAALGVFAILRGLKYQLALYSSYIISIENKCITRLQQNTPTITMYFTEITGITKASDGTLTVKGVKPGDIIYIPPSVENQADIELLLSNITPIEERAPFIQRYSLFVSATFFILMACLYTVNNKAVVAISGTVVSVVLLWGMYRLQTSKNMDAKVKRNTLSALVVLISVVVVTIIKLRR